MYDDTRLIDLAKRLRSGRIDRRRFLAGSAALGASAAAVSSALRIAPTRAQDMREVTMWTAWVDPAYSDVNAVVEAYNAQATDHQVTLVQIPPASETATTQLMTAVRGGTGPDLAPPRRREQGHRQARPPVRAPRDGRGLLRRAARGGDDPHPRRGGRGGRLGQGRSQLTQLAWLPGVATSCVS